MTPTAVLLLAGFMAPVGTSSAQSLPCSWPLKTDGTGLSNLAYPDTNAAYWTMPFEAGRWRRSMVVTGRYPKSRFMSLNTYNTKGDSAATLIDFRIDPDPRSRNPFREGEAGGAEPEDNYTITISKSPDGGSNQLQAGSGTNSNFGWLIYRLYVLDKRENETAGVPLPEVTLIDNQGGSYALSPCGFSKFAEGIAYVLQ
jgi:hypothetical protein